MPYPSFVQDLIDRQKAGAEAASYGGHIAKTVTSPDQYQQQIDQLQQQLAALPTGGGLYSSARRASLQGQISSLQNKIAQFNPNNGITPPVASAPILGPRSTAPRVGIDALKILLPTT